MVLVPQICNAVSSSHEDDDCQCTKRKLIVDAEKAAIETGSFETIETSFENDTASFENDTTSTSQSSFKSTD